MLNHNGEIISEFGIHKLESTLNKFENNTISAKGSLGDINITNLRPGMTILRKGQRNSLNYLHSHWR